MDEVTKAQMRQRLGNISQLQELLFGEQINEYNQRLAKHEKRLDRLEVDTRQFQSTISEQIKQLENNLTQQIDSVANSLDKKIKYLNLTTQEEDRKIEQELGNLSRHSHENLDFLQNSLNANTNSLKADINQSKSAIERDLRLLKQQIAEKLESNLTKLSANKVSREDLAEVLFELCLKLKGTDVNLELPGEAGDSGEITSTDLMLPETNGK